MPQFPIHTKTTAPDAARDTLETAEETFGFTPNLFGVMADAPAVLEGYMKMDSAFRQTSLTDKQQGVVLLSASRANGCDYCQGVHSAELAKADFPRNQIDAIRNGSSLADEKLDALRTFTQAVVENRGHVSDERIDTFLDAGYTRQHVLEVILGVAMKTLSNYTNHVADTPLDEALSDFATAESRATAGATA